MSSNRTCWSTSVYSARMHTFAPWSPAFAIQAFPVSWRCGSIGRLTEHDGVLIIDQTGIVRYMNSVAENQYRRVGYVDSLIGEQISEIDTNEYICFRSMDRGICLEQRSRSRTRSGSSERSRLFQPSRPRRFLFGATPVPATEPGGRRRLHPGHHRRGAARAGAEDQVGDDPGSPPPGEEQPADGGLPVAHGGPSVPVAGGRETLRQTMGRVLSHRRGARSSSRGARPARSTFGTSARASWPKWRAG